MSNNDWRLKIGKRRVKGEVDWEFELHTEFMDFADKASELAEICNWNFWGGQVGNYAVTLSQSGRDGKSISIKMLAGDKYRYYASLKKVWNPNNTVIGDYDIFVGDTVVEAIEYIRKFLKENKRIADFDSHPTCVMGGAYDRYPLAVKWAREKIEEDKMVGV